MEQFLFLLFLTLLGSIFGLIGGLAFLYIKGWSEWLLKYSTPFAAGVLLTVAIVGLLPEAVDSFGEGAYLITLVSFLTAFLFESLFFSIHHHDDEDTKDTIKGSVPLVIVGDTIHNFIDGAAIGASFATLPGLGLITAVSTFLHEVPHEIGDFGILLHAGWSKKSIILVNTISALVTIIGAFFVFFIFNDGSLLGVMLAIATGIFLYLGASDFLPNIHRHHINPIKSLIVLLIGVAIMIVTLKIVPHSH